MGVLVLLFEVDLANYRNLMPFVGVFLIVVWVMMAWRTRRRRAAARQTPLERAERYHQERGMQHDLEALMVEIEQLARRFAAQLDAKSVQLESLLRQADEKIARLEGQWPPPPPESSPDIAPPEVSAPYAPAEDGLTRDVYRLADAGHDPAAIARQLGEHVGKIELILALRPKKGERREA